MHNTPCRTKCEKRWQSIARRSNRKASSKGEPEHTTYYAHEKKTVHKTVFNVNAKEGRTHDPKTNSKHASQ